MIVTAIAAMMILTCLLIPLSFPQHNAEREAEPRNDYSSRSSLLSHRSTPPPLTACFFLY
jgi:hypothetical protein